MNVKYNNQCEHACMLYEYSIKYKAADSIIVLWACSPEGRLLQYPMKFENTVLENDIF